MGNTFHFHSFHMTLFEELLTHWLSRKITHYIAITLTDGGVPNKENYIDYPDFANHIIHAMYTILWPTEYILLRVYWQTALLNHFSYIQRILWGHVWSAIYCDSLQWRNSSCHVSLQTQYERAILALKKEPRKISKKS